MDVKTEDIEAIVVTGYTLWKWYHEAKKEKEKPQGKRDKRKPRGKRKY